MSDTCSVVVADDFDDGRTALIEYLRFRGFTVIEASNGRQAIDVVLRFGAKVVLMDLTMPEMDGLEATRRIKADPRTRDVVVIAVTANAYQRDQDAARLAGCDAFVSKPHDLEALVNLLKTFIPESQISID